MGIFTFSDLNQFSRRKLVKRFGTACGEGLYQMGHSYTLPKAAKDINEIKSYLPRLSEQVGRRLRRDNYQGKVVRVSLRFSDFSFWNK